MNRGFMLLPGMTEEHMIKFLKLHDKGKIKTGQAKHTCCYRRIRCDDCLKGTYIQTITFLEKDFNKFLTQRSFNTESQATENDLIDFLLKRECNMERIFREILFREELQTLSHRDLSQLCKDAKITNYRFMNKQEMIEVLDWNKWDKSIISHPSSQEKKSRYNKKIFGY